MGSQCEKLLADYCLKKSFYYSIDLSTSKEKNLPKNLEKAREKFRKIPDLRTKITFISMMITCCYRMQLPLLRTNLTKGYLLLTNPVYWLSHWPVWNKKRYISHSIIQNYEFILNEYPKENKLFLQCPVQESTFGHGWHAKRKILQEKYTGKSSQYNRPRIWSKIEKENETSRIVHRWVRRKCLFWPSTYWVSSRTIFGTKKGLWVCTNLRTLLYVLLLLEWLVSYSWILY